jgi:hypothetical protein
LAQLRLLRLRGLQRRRQTPQRRLRAPKQLPSLRDVGTHRSAVVDTLGKPAGSITIPGDDGFVDIWTYQLTDGSAAKLTIEKGVVVAREPQTPDP